MVRTQIPGWIFVVVVAITSILVMGTTKAGLIRKLRIDMLQSLNMSNNPLINSNLLDILILIIGIATFIIGAGFALKFAMKKGWIR